MAARNKSEKSSRLSLVEIRALSIEDLSTKIEEGRRELMHSRMKHAVAQLEKTSELKFMRKQVARMMTILNEKQQRA